MESDQLTFSSKGDDMYIKPMNNKHTETVIFLHGLGDSSQGGWFNVFVHQSTSPCPSTTRVALLQAPTAPVTLNMGMSMPSWYDIKTLAPSPDKFEESLGLEEVKKNAERINKVLKDEIELLGGDSTRVFIAGFSQGCAMALHVGLQYDKPLGGIFGWSGYLFPITEVNEANATTPLLLANGLSDVVVNPSLAEMSFKRLADRKGDFIRLKEKGLGHSVNENILKETKKFLKKAMTKEEKPKEDKLKDEKGNEEKA